MILQDGTLVVPTGPLQMGSIGTPGLAITIGKPNIMGLTIGKTLLKHKRVILFVSSLKKTVMKLRPQVQGPIDVG